MAKGSFSANITDERILNPGLEAHEFASDISIDTSGNVAVSSITSGVNISGGTLITSTSIDESIVANGTGNLTKNDVNLSNVDNTSDLNKPINSNIQSEINTMTGSYFTATANGSLINGDACVIRTDGTVSGLTGRFSASQSPLNTNNFVGFSDAAYSNGQTARILTSGSSPPNMIGLTTGALYYANFDGIATTPDSSYPVAIPVGRALGPNTLIIT